MADMAASLRSIHGPMGARRSAKNVIPLRKDSNVGAHFSRTKITLVFLIAASCSACSSSSTAQQQPAKATPPPPVSYRASFSFKASFSEPRLVGGGFGECLDMSVDFAAPKTAGPEWKPAVDPVAKIKGSFPQGTVSELTSSCLSAIPQVPLATCERHFDKADSASGGMATYRFTTFYYNFETVFGSGFDRQQCSVERGVWRTVAKGSPAWQEAHDDWMRRQPPRHKIPDDL